MYSPASQNGTASPTAVSAGHGGGGRFSGRVAVVHEWFDGYAGSEQCVEQMLHLYPQADVFGLVDFLSDKDRHFLQGRPVHTSFIQRLPLARRKFRAYLPLMPLAIEQFDLDSYELVLSSNHAVAKGVLTREDQVHLCYVHTPIRYAWDLYHRTLKTNGLTRGLKSCVARLGLHYLRIWDFATASRVNAFAANSRYVARRIWKAYRRRARVIYPPVAIDRFQLERNKEDFYLTVSRLVPYKHVDLIVEAFRRMPEKRLVVIGDGPEYARLAERAPANVQMLGRQPADVVEKHMQSARAFVFAADEDFGIAPIEVQACGTPVIAYGHGGSTETVVEGQTGLYFPTQDAGEIVKAVEAFEACESQFDYAAIRAHAERFSTERFHQEYTAFVDHHLNKRSRHKRRVPAGATS
jgi:glycosyltransferase involved in cell wall biosynthesis